MKKRALLPLLLLSGLLIRLFLMLFTFHYQFLQLYFFAYRSYIGEMQAFHSSYSTGLQFIINIWFSVIAVAAPGVLNLFELLPKGEPLTFAHIPMAFYYTGNLTPFLFTARIPFFLADLACIFLLAKLFHSWKAVFFWVFNPVIWVGVYIFGRPEILIALLLLSAYYCYLKNRYLLASLQLFLAHLFCPVLLLFTFPFFLLKSNNPLFQQQTGIIALSLIMYFFYPHLFTFIVGTGIALLLFFHSLGKQKNPLLITPFILLVFTLILVVFNLQAITRFPAFLHRIQQAQLTSLLLNFRLSGIYVELYIIIVYLIFTLLLLTRKSIPASRDNILSLLFFHTVFILLLMFSTLEYLVLALPVLYLGSWKKYNNLPLLIFLGFTGFILLLMHWNAEIFIHSLLLFAPRQILEIQFLSEAMPFQLATLGKSILAGSIIFILLHEAPRLKKTIGY